LIKPLPFSLFDSFNHSFASLDFSALAKAISIILLISKETAIIVSSLFSIVIHFQLSSHLIKLARSFSTLAAI
jgi:hypothetical protein